MKKNILTIVLILSFIGSINAQDVRFGIRGGLNLANISTANSTPLYDDYSMRLASGGGIFTEVQMNSAFSLRFGVEYSGQGAKRDGVQALSTQRMMTGIANNIGMSIAESDIMMLMGVAGTSPFYYANIENTIKYDYVTVPILAQYTFNLGTSPFGLYVNAGPFVSFAVSGKEVGKGTSLLYANASQQTTVWDILPVQMQNAITAGMPSLATTLQSPYEFDETNITGELKSVNFGLTGNIGLRYQSGRNSFFVEGGGGYGFIPVQQDDVYGKSRLSFLSVMVGYSFSMF